MTRAERIWYNIYRKEKKRKKITKEKITKKVKKRVDFRP